MAPGVVDTTGLDRVDHLWVYDDYDMPRIVLGSSSPHVSNLAHAR